MIGRFRLFALKKINAIIKISFKFKVVNLFILKYVSAEELTAKLLDALKAPSVYPASLHTPYIQTLKPTLSCAPDNNAASSNSPPHISIDTNHNGISIPSCDTSRVPELLILNKTGDHKCNKMSFDLRGWYQWHVD